MVRSKGRAYHGILRLVNLSTKQQVAVCLQVLSRYGQELEAGAIVTAEVTRVRIRSGINEN